MRQIELTQGKFALVDDEDFDELNKHKWHAFKGKNKHVYYTRRSLYKPKRSVSMHRTIMNSPSHLQVDHIDGNGLNNQKENLRICTNQQNCVNTRIRKDNTSGVKGVHWEEDRKRWRARMRVNRKTKHIGYYISREDAKKAYDKKAKEYFGEFASDGIGKVKI